MLYIDQPSEASKIGPSIVFFVSIPSKVDLDSFIKAKPQS